MTAPRSILITGASSGIGEGLAIGYAAPSVTLFLSGRDQTRLEAAAFTCRTKGAEVETAILDVTDADAMAAWINGCDAKAPLDLVIANAGISAGSGGVIGETAEQARAIFDVNLGGVMNTLLPAIPLLRARKAGQIAIISSLAGFRGMPGAPAYSASKAAVRVWGEGLRGWLARDNVRVSVITPGFVKSRMTAVNKFRMPFLMETGLAVQFIQQGLAANRGRITFPWRLYSLIWLANLLPSALVERIVARLPGKE